MRILPNSLERAELLNATMALSEEYHRSQVALVLKQPMDVISGWMKSIVENQQDTIAMLQEKGVIPMVVSMREDVTDLQPEPAMGSIMVLGVHSPERTDLTEAFYNSVLWQRIWDFYGPDNGKQIMQFIEELWSYVDLPAMVFSFNDPETPYLILVRNPEIENDVVDETALRAHATTSFDAVFALISDLERNAEPPFLPRRMIRTVVVEGNPRPVEVRGWGYDAELLLNGCEGDAFIDRLYAEEFWKAFDAYLRARPDVKTLRGLGGPSVTDLPTEAANDA